MILLADEPTANLDSVAGEEVFGLLQRFAKDQHKLVVMVSHEPQLSVSPITYLPYWTVALLHLLHRSPVRSPNPRLSEETL